MVRSRAEGEMTGTRPIVRRWSILLGAWLAVALFACGAIWMSRHMLHQETPLRPLLVLELPVWFFWLAAAVFIVRLTRRHPLDRQRPWTSLAIHLACAIALATVFTGFRMLWYQAFNPFPYLDTRVSMWFWRTFREQFVGGFTLYWAVVGVHHAFANYSRFRQRDLEATLIRGELAEARLAALRLQLRPHFLFNALNTVASVLEENPRKARRIIGRLGELLRASLRTDASALVTLREEVELVEAYLEIESERFGGRLGHDIDVAPTALDVCVPSFILQPLLENAIRHGIVPREGPGHVTLRARLQNETLEIQVEDDGVGLAEGPIRDGIGLGNARRRLEATYGARASLALEARAAGGLTVRLRMPAQRRHRASENVA
jgi:hypothetical protein